MQRDNPIYARAFDQNRAQVLLIGHTAGAFAILQKFFEARGWQCFFAASAHEALVLFGRRSFHVILDTTPFQTDPSALFQLAGFDCSVFRSCAVENGCWWLPVMFQGKECFGSAAFRSKEFIARLEKIVSEVEYRTTAAV
jgi:hypothetical protein